MRHAPVNLRSKCAGRGSQQKQSWAQAESRRRMATSSAFVGGLPRSRCNLVGEPSRSWEKAGAEGDYRPWHGWGQRPDSWPAKGAGIRILSRRKEGAELARRRAVQRVHECGCLPAQRSPQGRPKAAGGAPKACVACRWSLHIVRT